MKDKNPNCKFMYFYGKDAHLGESVQDKMRANLISVDDIMKSTQPALDVEELIYYKGLEEADDPKSFFQEHLKGMDLTPAFSVEITKDQQALQFWGSTRAVRQLNDTIELSEGEPQERSAEMPTNGQFLPMKAC